MKREDLQELIRQIKKYNLTKAFKDLQSFDGWLSCLNEREIRNINSLTVDPSLIPFPTELLIHVNLLKCNDYTNRIKAMLKLKNEDFSCLLFSNLCALSFLNSKNYYRDLEIMSGADSCRYALRVINRMSFINSKFHEDDLKLICSAEDSLVAECLAMVAGCEDSIKSPYHKRDMELIAKSSDECLQSNGLYPDTGINRLAINAVSLTDRYHFENMQILANNSEIGEFLFNIMTNPDIIKGKYYREEVSALVNAKSKMKALAIYYYITNPEYVRSSDFSDYLFDLGLDYSDISFLSRSKSFKNKKANPKYLDYIKLLNKVDDKFVMYFEALLSNEDFLNSRYIDGDLSILTTITNKDIFIDLFRVMSNSDSLNGVHHESDIQTISIEEDDEKRELLVSIATRITSINSIYHQYDMQFVSTIDLSSMDKECYDILCYYLFNSRKVNAQNHIEMLEKIYSGEIKCYDDTIKYNDVIAEYLDNLEKEVNSVDNKSNKGHSRVLEKFRRLFGQK